MSRPIGEEILSAAVAAAIEQAAEAVEGCWVDSQVPAWFVIDAQKRIRALQTEDVLAALREFGMKVAVAAYDDGRHQFYEGRYHHDISESLGEIVDRVMKGE